VFAVAQDLSPAEGMPGLQAFLELSANPPQRLQRDAMLAQLTRHEQLNQIEEAGWCLNAVE
jgi:hypothetical protein